MKKILLYLFLTALPLGAQEISIEQARAPQSAPFAQPFSVQYRLTHTPGYEVTLDPETFPKEFEIQQVSSSPQASGEETYDLTVFPFVLGKSTFTVTFQLSQDGKTVAQTQKPLYIEVTPVKTFPDKKLREIRAPHIPAGWLAWLLAAVVLAALVYAVYLYRSRQRQVLALRQSKDSRPSHVIALTKIDALINSGLWENQQYKLFYITLIDILREYLARRFELDTSADTSAELIARLKTRPALHPFLPQLRQLLSESDLVKFARAVPQEAQRNRDVRLLSDFVQATVPQPQPPEEKPL